MAPKKDWEVVLICSKLLNVSELMEVEWKVEVLSYVGTEELPLREGRGDFGWCEAARGEYW